MPRIWILVLLVVDCAARGRYEFIEDADLPAFYSMRSAQLAQKAQTPQVMDYSQYLQYQYYQPQMLAQSPQAQAGAINFNPYVPYPGAVLRPVVPPTVLQIPQRPVAFQQAPIYMPQFVQAQPTMVSGNSPQKKKT
ncbi:unnamed protein product [Caenorhabditis auriculariae]|uniref:Uncharacterized protein n=1 Tax=Caenorhabditis auriculariae TaxID=2777116 RepID=A0A8S1H1R2_9PELO|nr:unnamed protein product [Caenorhabditis auriculariae]